MSVCVAENAAALEELLLEYESKQMSISKGSSIKYETTHTHTHTHAHKSLHTSQSWWSEESHGKFGWNETVKSLEGGSCRCLARGSNKTKSKCFLWQDVQAERGEKTSSEVRESCSSEMKAESSSHRFVPLTSDISVFTNAHSFQVNWWKTM